MLENVDVLELRGFEKLFEAIKCLNLISFAFITKIFVKHHFFDIEYV